MATAPEPILLAGLETIRWALVCCRNWTLRDDASTEQVNDLMEAIHEVPAMLMHWEAHDVDELRTHCGCFRADHWRHLTGGCALDVPDLVKWFDQRLSELENRT